MSPHRRVSLLPGDGIGPEVVGAALDVIDHLDLDLEWESLVIGQRAIDAGASSALPHDVLSAIERTGVALKGPVTTTTGSTFRSPNIGLRRELDLFAQARFIRSFDGLQTPGRDVDLVIVRETTEDLYAGVEYAAGSGEAQEIAALIARSRPDIDLGAAFSIKPVSATAVERAARFTFDFARANKRRRVTVAHKSSVMRATDGLFLEATRDVARSYPDVECDDVLIDALALHLVRAPASYDVVFTLNLYGDILADLAAGLVGGIGTVAGGNYGDRVAVFEAAHGSVPKYAGLGRADPVATILSAALLLRHLGEADAATRVEDAVADVVATGRCLTADLAALVPGAEPVGTKEMTAAVVAAL